MIGSFGDNELSPECLDPCIAHCLRVKRSPSLSPGPVQYSGVCIPQAYSSRLTPVSCCKAYMSAKEVGPGHRPQVSTVCTVTVAVTVGWTIVM